MADEASALERAREIVARFPDTVDRADDELGSFHMPAGDWRTILSALASPDAVAVEQSDEDAARGVEWVQTTIDDHLAIVAAFSAHRLAERERCARIAEYHRFDPGLSKMDQRFNEACSVVAAAIRAHGISFCR